LLDVRTAAEYAAGHLPGSIHIPLGRLPQRLAELPRRASTLVYCQGGSRSPIAASILQAHGWGDIMEMRDGYDGWQAAAAEPALVG
ncbi:hypothetical protein SE17_44360, partial [Kouleothrix aurantiaca]